VLYGVPLLPRTMLEDQERAVEIISTGVADLANRGARAVGLGALCAVVGSRGRAIADQSDVAVTTGHELTAWAAVRTVDRVCRLLDRDVDAPIAVLGAPWVVAVAAAEALARRGRRVLVAIQGKGGALARIAKRSPGMELLGQDEALARARLVVSASSGGGVLAEGALAKGTVLIDVARPRDLTGARTRSDVLSVDGETISLPAGAQLGGITTIYNWVVGQGAADVFACFAAPMLASLGDLSSPMSTSRFPEPDEIEAWGAAAEHRGFHVDNLYDRGKRLDPEVLRRWGSDYPAR
jgi:predicted amino acid dehydrogenase